MRRKRVEKYRRRRHASIRNLIVFGILLPASSVILGYLITSLVILPSMPR